MIRVKPATVERHVANMYRKLGASGRATPPSPPPGSVL